MIHQEPTFAGMFIAHLLGQTIRVEADLVDQLFDSSGKRLARMLLLLANFGKETKPIRLSPRSDRRHSRTGRGAATFCHPFIVTDSVKNC